jgi:hypothetical protein
MSLKEKWKGWEDREEDISSYWIIKGGGAGIIKRKLEIIVSGEPALEKTMDLS